jgi:hypothetical protein
MTKPTWLSGMIGACWLPLATTDLSRVQGPPCSVLFERADGKRERLLFLLVAHSAVTSQPLLAGGSGYLFVGGYRGVDHIPGQRDRTR